VNGRLTVAAAAAALLASVSLFPLVLGGGWFLAGTGAIIVVAGIGALCRLRSLPVLACLAAALAGLFLYLNALFAGQHSVAVLIPTRSSVAHLGLLIAQAHHEMSRYAPPVPASQGILLLAAGGIGLVAVMTDLLAVRLRKPALAGLPLLVLFCVPLATDSRPGWLAATATFCLGMAGYLGLLSAEARDRLRVWGHLVRRWYDDPDLVTPDTRPLAAAGRRIGLMAVALAVCLPLLVPSLKQHQLFEGAGEGSGGHGPAGQISLPNPTVELTQQLHESRAQTVLTYKTTALQPPYLQVWVLDQLSTSAWTMTVPRVTDELRAGALPAVPGLSPGTPGTLVRETITLGNHLTSGGTRLTYLPVPYPARSVQVTGTWRVDPASLAVLAVGARPGGLRYTVTSDQVIPTALEERASSAPPAGLASDLYVPPAFDSLKRLAERITAGHASAFGQALALQNWFTRPGNFTYSLNVPPANGANALVRFLTTTKRGYCQQFAFAMAVLARLLGIPSRVAVGYTQGSYTGNETWVVRTSDAHAWPELFIPGAGWLAFEPTPGGLDVGQATATPPLYTYPATPGGAGPPPLSRTGASGHSAPGNRAGIRPPLGKLRHLGAGAGGGSRPRAGALPVFPLLLLALGLLALLLAGPGLARILVRRWRWWKAGDQDAARAHVAWRELCDDLADHRVERRASESPRALACRLAATLGLDGPDRAALERITVAEERASYASRPASPGSLARDVTRVRRAVARASGPGRRSRALLLPRSVLGPAWDSAQRALAALGRLEAGLSRRRDVALRRPWKAVLAR
jgi:transglutaminase-like putative cysteine protease